LVALLVVWWNHFDNAFHFDDFHTVQDNPAIRSLANIPRFFEDGRTFSILAENQGWRPLVSTSLAFDYALSRRLGHGMLAWHLSTFFVFLAQLVCMFYLFRAVMERAQGTEEGARAASASWVALFAVAVYGLHPVCAETVNYIIQRADVFVAFGFVLSMALYATVPRARRSALYLVGFFLAALAKPTALAFPLVMALWIALYGQGPRRWLGLVPPLLAAVGMGWIHKVMTPPTYVFGGTDPYGYRITQPVIALHYVRSFFWPTALSADTDWPTYTSLADPRVIGGFLFVAALVAVTAWTARAPRLRPIAFGLGWFMATFIPTAIPPLAEVTNDHRMYLPMVGLALAFVWCGWLVVERFRVAGPALAVGLLLLCALGAGTMARNAVWTSEATLWADVVQKSPRNGRGWMNYGLTFMRNGDYARALDCFHRALELTPNYAHLEVNLGIAEGALGHDVEAEKHFQRALTLDARSAMAEYFYGRWLHGRRRDIEAAAALREGLRRNPYDMPSRDLLMEIYNVQGKWAELGQLVEETRRMTPDDTMVNAFATMAKSGGAGAVAKAEAAVKAHPSPESWLDLSLAYHNAGRYPESIGAARHALELRPGYAEAWNNIAAADLGLHRWDEAIDAANRALAIKPDFPLARNNRAYAEEQKRASASPDLGRERPSARSPGPGK
jgi:tetratricopeptide (TPR) repeat protein